MSSPLFSIFLAWRLSWFTDQAIRQNSERGHPKDNCCQVWFKMAQWFQWRRALKKSLRQWPEAGRQVMAKAHITF